MLKENLCKLSGNCVALPFVISNTNKYFVNTATPLSGELHLFVQLSQFAPFLRERTYCSEDKGFSGCCNRLFAVKQLLTCYAVFEQIGEVFSKTWIIESFSELLVCSNYS